MSVKLSWNLQENLTNIHIYRATAPISPSELPEPLAILPPTATEYVSIDDVIGVFYYYYVASVNDDGVTLGRPRYSCVRHDDGPNIFNAISPRGDDFCRYFGSGTMFAAGEFHSLLNAFLPSASAASIISNATAVHKYIYKGKVLLIIGNDVKTTYDVLNNNGLLFGTNDPELLPPWAAEGVNHCPTIVHQDRTYNVRTAKISNKPFGTFITDQDDVYASELAQTHHRIYNGPVVPGDESKYRACFINYVISPIAGAMGPHLYSESEVAHCSETVKGQLLKSPRTASLCWTPVLELVQ